MAFPKIGFNEGSLLRRTLLHVCTFVVGSVAFIGVVSFLLVSIAKGVVAPRTGGEDEAEAPAVASAAAKAGKPPGKPGRAKREPTVPAVSPSKDD